MFYPRTRSKVGRAAEDVGIDDLIDSLDRYWRRAPESSFPRIGRFALDFDCEVEDSIPYAIEELNDRPTRYHLPGRQTEPWMILLCTRATKSAGHGA